MTGVCKFCGCTENAPCVWTDATSATEYGDIARVACAWLLENVCTNPDCVLKAYLEARPAAESLMGALALIAEAA